jgi:hypothetical protein
MQTLKLAKVGNSTGFIVPRQMLDRLRVESCLRLKVSLRDYLSAVLPGLSDLPVKKVSVLTSSAWAAAQ